MDRRPVVKIRSGTRRRWPGPLLARETGLPLAVRSGGHSVAGHSVADGGMVLDLSRMRDLQIDVDGRSAWVEAGLTAAEYTNAVAAHGLVTGFGDTGSVGLAVSPWVAAWAILSAGMA